MNRNEFLHQFSMLCLSCPGIFKSRVKTGPLKLLPPGKTATASFIQKAGGTETIIDMHCHPGLKYFLWGKKLWKKHPSRKGRNMLNLQVDVHKVQKGYVKGFIAAHYLPEKGLVTSSGTTRVLFPVLRFLVPGLSNKVEQGDDNNFDQMMGMLDDFEAQVATANARLAKKKPGTDIIKVARSCQEFEQLLKAGIIPVAQSIEGAHALGRNAAPPSTELYMARVQLLFERGICMVTLAHFFPNDLCFPVEGIPPWNKVSLGYTWFYDPDTCNKPLTPLGRSIVEHMLKIGIIVDITHLTPAARAEVFTINEKFRRPVVFSHTGVQHLFRGPADYKNYLFYCVSDEELDNISKCRGVIGLIFMPYFLTGNDNHLNSAPHNGPDQAIAHIIETIQYIRARTGTYENIALGSDFDNFSSSPSDLRDASYFPGLVNQVRTIAGITEEEVNMISHGNALRVLKEGWKR